jgi:hypothetical protein
MILLAVAIKMASQTVGAARQSSFDLPLEKTRISPAAARQHRALTSARKLETKPGYYLRLSGHSIRLGEG